MASPHQAAPGFSAWPRVRQTDWRVQRAAQATPQQVADRHFVKAVTSRTLPMLRDAGVVILTGTDAGFLNSFNYPGFSLHDELELYVKLGLTPREALNAQWLNAALTQGRDALAARHLRIAFANVDAQGIAALMRRLDGFRP